MKRNSNSVEINRKKKRRENQEIELLNPRHLLVSDAISNREFEIRALEKAISNASEHTGAIRVFQVVKRYQRRRAASYNVKRLPKYIRSRALAQMERDPDQQKKVTRRVKRSPARLLSFKTRAGLWLETHLWHVKRMKMCEMHGRRIAMEPNQKSARSMYRAACYEAVVHDASYEKIVQIEGLDVDLILKGLHRISDPSVASMGAKQYLNGSKAGCIFIHKLNQYPLGSIAPVNFLWQQQSKDNCKKRLWIWTPLGTESAIYAAVKRALFYACDREGSAVEANDFSDFEIGGILVSMITDMVKFQFYGPRSHAVLTKCLKLASSPATAASRKLWENLNTLESSNILPDGAVLGLEIEDPRIHFPVLMDKRAPTSDTCEIIQKNVIIPLVSTWPTNVSVSLIWDSSVRESAVSNRSPMAHIQTRRSVPGHPLVFEPEKDTTLPILLIHRPSRFATTRSDLTHGWDLVLPKGWGQAMLNTCVFAGLRVAGFTNRGAFSLEAGLPVFPRDFPETAVCGVEDVVQEGKALDKYKRTPKGKRFKYEKAGWKVPFRPAFQSLLANDDGGGGGGRKREVFVFHSERVVSLIKTELERKHASYEVFIHECRKAIKNLLSFRSFSSDLKQLDAKEFANGMLRVHLYFPNGGNVVRNSKIHSSIVDQDGLIGNKDLIGFTTVGAFSLLRGHSTAFGCCTLTGLYSAFKSFNAPGHLSLYVRPPFARQSRACKFEIVP